MVKQNVIQKWTMNNFHLRHFDSKKIKSYPNAEGVQLYCLSSAYPAIILGKQSNFPKLHFFRILAYYCEIECLVDS